MRKLISKIAGLMLGLSLAAGVGVAAGSGVKVRAVYGADTTIDLTAQGFSNQQEVTTVTSGDFTLTFAKGSGSNAPKYYTSGSSVRTYANNTLTVSTSGSENISQIVFTLGGTTTAIPTANTGTYDSSSKTWTGSATSVTFTNASSGQYHYKTVAITTSGGGGGETDPVLQSIAVSGEKTEYNVGDEFVKPTVTATYDKGDPQDVTSSASCTGYNMGVAGEYTVTVSYGGKTAEYSITVNAAEPSGDVLYSCNFTDVGTHGYTQNKTFTLNEKAWTASVSQVNGGVFYLGCNSTNAAKGILNDNSTFADIVTALKANDSPYNSGYTTAHAYALLFDNAYENVASVEFAWAGGNNAFQVYLFGDKGSGFELLGSTNYATSGQAVSGNVVWNASGNGENFSSFAIVARPGATGSTATNKTLRAASFQIIAGESVDPSLESMVIKESGNAADGSSFNYSSTSGEYVFAAYNESDLVTGVTWSTSDTSVATINSSTGALTILKPEDVTIYAEAEGYNKASATIHINKGNLLGLSISGELTTSTYYTNQSWSHDGLITTASYSTGWEEDVSSDATWSYSPSSPVLNTENVTITATLSGQSDSSVQSVSVLEAHQGTEADPFTVAEGIAKCKENSGSPTGTWYVEGVISKKTAWDSRYTNVTYWISEDGTGTDDPTKTIECFRGKYLNNADVTSSNEGEFAVGKIVVVRGTLKNYQGTTPEFDAGNYPISIEEPDTGDVDVTFAPSVTSYEIGASGAFTATSETQGVSYSWAVDNSNVLTVNSSTGAFQAVGLGVARVTVTATANEKEGFAFADITVNGSASDVYSVSEANTIASAVSSGQTTSYYIYVEGYVKEFATSMSGTSPRAFDITNLNESSTIMVYTNVNPYSSFIEGLSLGDYIVVKANVQNYSGTYELTSPEKISSSSSAMSFAIEFMSQTDAVCTGYVDGDDNSAELGAIWNGFAISFDALSEVEQGHLVNTTGCGATIINAMARYDYLVSRYSNLDRFVTGRIVNGAAHGITPIQINNSSSTIIIVVVALTSITSIGVLLVIKRKRSLVK